MSSSRPKAGRLLARALYIVDSDGAVREGLARVAASAGFNARQCASAGIFLGEANAADAACAVVDVSDAGLRDPEVRSRLSALAAVLPVIALSARDDAETQRTARQVGARAFFRKPVDAAALLDSVAWVIRKDKTA